LLNFSVSSISTSWCIDAFCQNSTLMFKSPNPVFNVMCWNEPVATNTIYSDTPAIDGGETYTQIFIGTKILLTDIYGMKSSANFPSTLMDNIRYQGALTKLISPLLWFDFYEHVYYHIDDASFPSDSKELCGHWVGISENVGNFMTFKILTVDSKKVIYRSNIPDAKKNHLDHLNINIPQVIQSAIDRGICNTYSPLPDHGEGNAQQGNAELSSSEDTNDEIGQTRLGRS